MEAIVFQICECIIELSSLVRWFSCIDNWISSEIVLVLPLGAQAGTETVHSSAV